ncbi:MAG TPA: porin [Planctomycetota bacterium]|nr:porin [Planctomycetota bacterium]
MGRTCVAILLVACALALNAHAQSVADLKKEVEQLRKDIAAREGSKASAIGNVDSALGAKYGPNTPVTTKAGKLQIGGLVQVWYQHIANDQVGIVTAAGGNGLDNSAGGFPPPEPNETLDNDTFRIRRTELRFTMDIHENITGYVMIDPAREANITFTPVPTFPAHNARFGGNNTNLQSGVGLQAGNNTIIPQLLQDAYINFHGFVPHHDFTIGQFKPPAGEEAWRNSGQLEFVERAMVTAVNNVRDLGLMVHGSFVDNRVQYWAGVFNGPDGTVLTDPEILEGGNRSDDNDAKDIAFRLAVRPVWNAQCWYGRLELGGARTDGWRGESGQGFNVDQAINGLNRSETAISRTAAWVWYRPGGEVRGWWLRYEYGNGHDRYTPSRGFNTNLLAIGGATDADGNVIGQLNPKPVNVEGWYFGTGYKLSDSRWADDLKECGRIGSMLHDMEFVFRAEQYENIAAEDLVRPDRETDQFKTTAYTAGFNYYIKGHDCKIQANYIWVDEPSDNNPNRGLREVDNNQFVLAFQVMF